MVNGLHQPHGMSMDELTAQAIADNQPKRGKISVRRKVKDDNFVDRLSALFEKQASVNMVTAFLHSPNKNPVQFINSLSVLESKGFLINADKSYRATLLGLWGKAVQKMPDLPALPEHIQAHSFIGMMIKYKSLPIIVQK